MTPNTLATAKARTFDPLDEWLDRKMIAKPHEEGGFDIPEPTQICWYQTNRYGWRSICAKVGKVRARRRDIIAVFESRKGLVQEPVSKASPHALANANPARGA